MPPFAINTIYDYLPVTQDGIPNAVDLIVEKLTPRRHKNGTHPACDNLWTRFDRDSTRFAVFPLCWPAGATNTHYGLAVVDKQKQTVFVGDGQNRCRNGLTGQVAVWLNLCLALLERCFQQSAGPEVPVTQFGCSLFKNVTQQTDDSSCGAMTAVMLADVLATIKTGNTSSIDILQPAKNGTNMQLLRRELVSLVLGCTNHAEYKSIRLN